MVKNLRPFLATSLLAVTIFLITFFVYRVADSSGLILSNCLLYALLGILVGRTWTVYPWQIGLLASLPGWIFLAWRLFTTEAPYDIGLSVPLFYFVPSISMIASYVGTYFGRWLAFRRKQKSRAAAKEEEKSGS